MKKIGFALGLVFLAQVCAAGDYDQYFYDRVPNADVYIKYVSENEVRIKIGNKCPKEGILYSMPEKNEYLAISFDYFKENGEKATVDDYDICVTNRDNDFNVNIPSRGLEFWVKDKHISSIKIYNNNQDAFAFEAPNISTEQHWASMQCGGFYAKVDDDGRFDNYVDIDSPEILIVSKRIFNWATIGQVNKKAESFTFNEIPNDPNNFGSNCLLNVGSMYGDNIKIEGLPVFSPGKIYAKNITIDGVTEPKVDGTNSNTGGTPDDVYKKLNISDEAVNTIKQREYRTSQNSYVRDSNAINRSININSQQLEQINKVLETRGGRSLEKVELCNNLFDFSDNGELDDTLIVHCENKDLYNKTTLSASLPVKSAPKDLVLSPNVYVIRDNDGKSVDNPFKVSVLNIPVVVYDNNSESPEDFKERMQNNINKSAMLLKYFGYKNLVIDVPSFSCDVLDPFLIAQYFYNALLNHNFAYEVIHNKVRFVLPGDDCKAKYWRDAFRYKFSTQIKKDFNDKIHYESDETDMETHQLDEYKLYVDLGIKVNDDKPSRHYVLVTDEMENVRLMATINKDTLRDTTVTEKTNVYSHFRQRAYNLPSSDLTLDEQIFSLFNQINNKSLTKSLWQQVTELQPQQAS